MAKTTTVAQLSNVKEIELRDIYDNMRDEFEDFVFSSITLLRILWLGTCSDLE